MKSWIEFPDDLTDWRRVLAHKLGGFIARLLLFASIFLLHPGERCAYETDRMPGSLEDASSGVISQPVADAPSRPDDLPPTF